MESVAQGSLLVNGLLQIGQAGGFRAGAQKLFRQHHLQDHVLIFFAAVGDARCIVKCHDSFLLVNMFYLSEHTMFFTEEKQTACDFNEAVKDPSAHFSLDAT